jgi:transcription initiation factor IIF auxiliary subunit
VSHIRINGRLYRVLAITRWSIWLVSVNPQGVESVPFQLKRVSYA